jgi:hypothetical protein
MASIGQSGGGDSIVPLGRRVERYDPLAVLRRHPLRRLDRPLRIGVVRGLTAAGNEAPGRKSPYEQDGNGGDQDLQATRSH